MLITLGNSALRTTKTRMFGTNGKLNCERYSRDLFPRGHPYVETYLDHSNFGNPLTVTLMVKVKEGTIYNPETLDKVFRMTREIDLAPTVDHDQIYLSPLRKHVLLKRLPTGSICDLDGR